MTVTYCLSCKKKTNDVNPSITSVNGRKSRVSKCAVCGTKKSVFVKGSTKGGNPLLMAAGPIAGAVGDVVGSLSRRGEVASNNIVKKGQLTGKYERINDKRRLKTYKQYIKAGIPEAMAMKMAFD